MLIQISGGERRHRKPKPERNPEKLLRRQSPRSKERAGNRARGGDTESDPERWEQSAQPGRFVVRALLVEEMQLSTLANAVTAFCES